jgi:hypothetical protein
MVISGEFGECSTGPPCFFAQKSGIGVAARLIAGNPMILEILAPDNPQLGASPQSAL